MYTEIGFFLNGRFLSNSSLVVVSEVGEGSGALYCLTNYNGTECLTHGMWTSPDGSNISEGSSSGIIYLTRACSSLHLNRRSGAVLHPGIYTCLIPDAMNVVSNVFIGIFDIDGQSYLGVDILTELIFNFVVRFSHCITVLR